MCNTEQVDKALCGFRLWVLLCFIRTSEGHRPCDFVWLKMLKRCPNWWNQHLDPEEDAERDSFSVQLDHWLEELTGVLGGHGQLHKLSPKHLFKRWQTFHTNDTSRFLVHTGMLGT